MPVAWGCIEDQISLGVQDYTGFEIGKSCRSSSWRKTLSQDPSLIQHTETKILHNSNFIAYFFQETYSNSSMTHLGFIKNFAKAFGSTGITLLACLSLYNCFGPYNACVKANKARNSAFLASVVSCAGNSSNLNSEQCDLAFLNLIVTEVNYPPSCDGDERREY